MISIKNVVLVLFHLASFQNLLFSYQALENIEIEDIHTIVVSGDTLYDDIWKLMKWNFHSIFFPFYMVVKVCPKLQRSPSLHSSTFSHSLCLPSLFVIHMGINVPKSQAAPWVAPPCGLPDKSDRFTSWLGSPLLLLPLSSSSSSDAFHLALPSAPGSACSCVQWTLCTHVCL